MRLPFLGFRAKLLLALVGSVGLLLGATLWVVRAQTGAQVQGAIDRTLQRARDAFAEQERFRQGQLLSLGRRFAGSNRLPFALDEALANDADSLLVGTLDYELELSGIGGVLPGALAVVTDVDGRAVAGRSAGAPLADAASAVAPAVAAAALAEADSAFGWHIAEGRLHLVHAVPLVLFDYAVGTLVLGSPVDDAVAGQLARAAEGEVCFVTGGRCVAASPGAREMAEAMVAAAAEGGPVRTERGGRRYALVSDRIDARGVPAWRVVAVPLDDALAPFERIRDAETVAGAVALALAVLLGLVLSRGLARPVRALVAATERVARGDYAARVPVASRDELGALAHAFNEMAHGLMLKERYRGVLDKVVSREVAEELVRGELALGGENREVTVLFADVRGFTTMTEGMEPQEVIALVNRVMERASAAVDAEGGVVDKYLGDQVMAVFGAPVAQDDAPARAVRAALRMRQAMAELSAERAAAGEPPVSLGAGINTGVAVAGNMGSADRLNYTVLGASVNVAARLCSEAAPGEVLVSAATWEHVRDGVEGERLGERMLKGLTRPVEVWSVDREVPADRKKPAGAAATAALALALALSSAASAEAQRGLPTLEEKGVAYVSPGGWLQVVPSGRLEVTGYAPGEEPSWIIPQADAFVAPRLSVFTDVFLGATLHGRVELRADRGEAPRGGDAAVRVQQAFVRWTPWPGTDLGVQAGMFVTPFGNWAQRHHTAADPLVRPPLLHDWRTMVCAGLVPRTAAGFAAWKDDPDRFRPMGAPIVWGAPYPTGVMAFGSVRGVAFRAGVVNSAPSSEPFEWNPDFGGDAAPSVVAHAAVQALPELRLGVSYNRGPYLWESVADSLPAGRTVDDYMQEMWGLEATYARGRMETRAELILDRWEVPNVGDDPRDLSYYVETKVRLTPGLFAAARFNEIRFNRIDVTEGAYPVGVGAGVRAEHHLPGGPDGRQSWDYDVRRWQLGAGYRFDRATEIRAEYLWNDTRGPLDPSDDLFSVQWSYAF